MLCHNQVRHAGMDGTVVGLDYTAVIKTLSLYDEGRDIFEDIVYCHKCKQELKQ